LLKTKKGKKEKSFALSKGEEEGGEEPHPKFCSWKHNAGRNDDELTIRCELRKDKGKNDHYCSFSRGEKGKRKKDLGEQRGGEEQRRLIEGERGKGS